MVDYLLNVFLGLVCVYFVENIWINVIREIGLLVSFLIWSLFGSHICEAVVFVKQIEQWSFFSYFVT